MQQREYGEVESTNECPNNYVKLKDYHYYGHVGFRKDMYNSDRTPQKKVWKLIFGWLSGNMLNSENQVSYDLKVQVFAFPTTCHSLQSVTSERRYGAVNMVRSHFKFDQIQYFQTDQSILQLNCSKAME